MSTWTPRVVNGIGLSGILQYSHNKEPYSKKEQLQQYFGFYVSIRACFDKCVYIVVILQCIKKFTKRVHLYLYYFSETRSPSS